MDGLMHFAGTLELQKVGSLFGINSKAKLLIEGVVEFHYALASFTAKKGCEDFIGG